MKQTDIAGKSVVKRLYKNRVALLLLIPWLPMTFFLYPIPTHKAASEINSNIAQYFEKKAEEMVSPKTSREMKEDAHTFVDPKYVREFWLGWLRGWTLYSVTLAVGLSACTMALLNVRGWRLALILSSLLYLVMHVRPTRMFIPRLESVQFWWLFVTRMPYGFLCAYKDLVFPIIQSIVVVTLCAGLVRHRKQNYLLVGSEKRHGGNEWHS